MPPLDRTFALAEVHDGAMMVAHHLHFDVPRVFEVLLDVHVGNAERRFRLALSRLDRVAELLRRADDAHPAAAAAGDGFHDHGETELRRELERHLFVFNRTVGARQQRQPRFLHRTARAGFVAHQPDHFRIRPDETDVAGLADFREIGRFGQKAVARMNRVSPGDLGCADNRGHVEVAFSAARGTDAHVFVGEPHMKRVLVGLRIHRHGLDAQLAARDDHAHRDFAAVRDQNFFKHWLLWRTDARRIERAGRSRHTPSRLRRHTPSRFRSSASSLR